MTAPRVPVPLPRLPHFHHRRLLARGLGRFRRLGPGLATGAADDDPSGIGTYSQVGAAYRFDLLWTTWLTLPLAAAVQETSARLGLVSSCGLAQLIGEVRAADLARRRGARVRCEHLHIGADLGSMAAAVRLIVPLPYAVLVLAIAGVTMALEIWLPYHRYSRILRWLTLSLVLYLAVLFVARVDWSQVARHLVLPTLPRGRAAVAALIATLGTTISPYLFFWQASEEVEESVEHPRSRITRDSLSAMRIDVVAGMTTAVVIMFAIMVASAVTLGAHGVTRIETADEAARALTPIAGRLAGLMFALGIVGTGLLAVPVLAAASAYALCETFGWKEGLSRKPSDAPAFYGVIAFSIVVGIGIQLVGVNPMRGLYYSAILNGIAAPPILLLMLLLSRALREEQGRLRAPVADALVGVTLVIMTALPLVYLLMRP